jgi:hypothetical protein
MTYSEDPKAMTKEFIKLCFKTLENILKEAKDKVCIDPESEDCVQLSKTDLTTLKNVLIKDPSATLDEATAQLLPYKALIEKLLAEHTETVYNEAFMEMRNRVQKNMAEQDTITGSGSSQ